MRHYEVISPEMCEYSFYEPIEPYRCWGIYLAKDTKDAIRQAVKDPEFRYWVKEQRADGQPPFKGLKAKRTICEHGICWGCGSENDPSETCSACAIGEEFDLEEET